MAKSAAKKAALLEQSPMRKLALLLEWDGTTYAGWQFQENALTIQATVEKALYKICGEEIRLSGCSRTDAGVHAWGHVSHFVTRCPIPVDRLPLALNALLPDSISCRSAAEVDADFHARFQTTGKQYSYYIYNSSMPSALYGRYAYHEARPLDLAAMRAAAKIIEGRHDFVCFMAAGGQVKTTVRTIYELRIEPKGKQLRFVVRGDGFLYNMVRIIAGTLLYVGLGKLSVADVEQILDCGRRSLAGKTLPACGLFLDEVYYKTPVFSDVIGGGENAFLLESS